MIQVIVEKDKRDDRYEREQHVKSFILWSKERAKNLIIEKDPLHSKSILNSSYAIKFENIGELGDKKEVNVVAQFRSEVSALNERWGENRFYAWCDKNNILYEGIL